MIVWVLETPKSCIIFAELMPGTGRLIKVLGDWIFHFGEDPLVELTIE